MPNKEKVKKHLTSEKLKAQFPNQFDLVNTAIHCARDIIRSGHEPMQNGESVNVAFLAVEMLVEDKEIGAASK